MRNFHFYSLSDRKLYFYKIFDINYILIKFLMEIHVLVKFDRQERTDRCGRNVSSPNILPKLPNLGKSDPELVDLDQIVLQTSKTDNFFLIFLLVLILKSSRSCKIRSTVKKILKVLFFFY